VASPAEPRQIYNYFRNYDAAIGRYVESDPLGPGAGSFSTYNYAGANPSSNFDPLGLYCTSTDRWTTCRYPGGPSFRLPTPEGFPSRINPSTRQLYHKYDVQRPIGCANPADVMSGLINSPVPTGFYPASPATPDGTPNNAKIIPFVENPVTSYLTHDLDTGNPIVVNLTMRGSQFLPGYVARTVVNGVAYSYGEGLNAWQSPSATAHWIQNIGNEMVWGRQMSKLITEAQSNCGCQ